jgi:uroporphyrinogen decarboxylase
MNNRFTFSHPQTPNWEGLIDCISRQKTPDRVHNIELFLDIEVKTTLCDRFHIDQDIDKLDPWYPQKREIAIQRFLGYDYVVSGPAGLDLPLNWMATEDTAEISRDQGRRFVDEHAGPITSWQSYEAYPWPDPNQLNTAELEWYQKHLPDDMCIIGGLTGSFAEYLSWLMGFETLCYALYDQTDLVKAIFSRYLNLAETATRLMLEFDRVKVIWGSDDMGFRSGPLISPKAMRKFVLPGHKRLAQLSHTAGRYYILHSCGKLDSIMDDLIEDVKIDGKHSYEDTILDVRDAKALWGDRISILGGIDMDFLCRADEMAIRQRVRDTLEICHPSGGYCLGTGNSVANYIPLDHYLAMLDEGRKFW